MFALFQTFAVVSADRWCFAERMRFSAVLLFCAAWLVLVYAPVALGLWAVVGFERGVMDFAGGTVHITAGVTA